MAGGSQILIDSQGVTVTTNGKVVFKAGQHVFESGERVLAPENVLPKAPTDYSRKFFIPPKVESLEKNIKHSNPTQIIGFRTDDHEPVFFEYLNTKGQEQEIETKRFYIDKLTNTIVHLFVDLPVMNIHENDDDCGRINE
ncbi:hypothetical protein [Acinetobacter rudis]|uniref:hypothetical protein n=1 Tax=Acinetobacter rudis TaxID=632955 RepID=UPI0033410E88